MTTRKLISLVAVAAMALCATPAVAAATKTFKGRTDQGRTVSFKLRGTKVVDFTGGVNMMCIQSGIEFNAAIPPGALAVKGGRFAYEGRDKIDSVDIEISGRITGRRATGRIEMHDSRYNAADQSFDSCVGSAKFTVAAR